MTFSLIVRSTCNKFYSVSEWFWYLLCAWRLVALFCDGFGVLRSRWAFCGQVFCSSFLVVGGYELLLSYFSYLTRTLDLHFRSNFHSPPLYHTKNLDDRFFFLTKPLGVNWTCRAWRVPLPHFARWVRRWKKSNTANTVATRQSTHSTIHH